MKDDKEFLEALESRKVPILVLDQKWHRLFALSGKTSEIKQLEEIGIRVDDQVLMLLHRFNGNVEWTLNYLYECHVCFYFYDPLLSFVPTDACARIHGIGCQLYVDSRSSQQ